MRKFYFAIYLLLICFACVTCNNSPKSGAIDPDCLNIKIEPSIHDSIFLSEMIESIRFIPLESDSNALIGEIVKIAYDNGFYFCQEENSNKLFCFDSEGRFIARIGKKGHGRGECLHPNAFALNKENKEVWIIDNVTKLKKYSYSGDFIDAIDRDRSFMSDYCISNGVWYCYTEKRTNWKNDNSGDFWCNELTVLYKNGRIERFFPVNKDLYTTENRITIPEPTPFSELNKSITFHHTVSDVIYSIDKETSKISSKYVVDFGEKKYKRDISQMKTMEILDYVNDHPDQAGFISNVVETEGFLQIRFRFAKRTNRAFYDKKTKQIKSGKPVNDIFTAPFGYIGQRDNRMIGYISDPAKIEFTEKAKAFVSPETISGLERLDDQSNPILIELVFKAIK